MVEKYKLAVFVGRFMPFHNGHRRVIKEGLKYADRVLILCGSSNRLVSSRNPFTFKDRSDIIKQEFFLDKDKIIVEPIGDYLYNEVKWINEIFEVVSKYEKEDIVLIGHEKNNTSYYLKKFPMWDAIDIKGVSADGLLIDATAIREYIFSDDVFDMIKTDVPKDFILNKISNLIPSSTFSFLLDFIVSPRYEEMYFEIKHDREYRDNWPGEPHVTTDAVCIQSNHVLLIKRKYNPGKGQWALPGGFLHPDEMLIDGCLRELKEEASPDIPPSVLKSKLITYRDFAHPHRSNRARIITFAFLFDLNSEIERKAIQGQEVPFGFTKIKAGDDAADAKWVNIETLKPEDLFEDHFDIIEKMIEYLQ